MVWEELPAAQRSPGYHPIIRFGCWNITRYTKSTTYMFASPELVQQGIFSIRDGHYTFQAIMANELERADIGKLTADMNAEAAQKLRYKYAQSMFSFEGDYDASTGALTIAYPVKGHTLSYELHATTEGDNSRTPSVSDAERGLVGLWQAPDPYPERLDAHWRAKIEEDGLPHFADEAKASDGAMFGILDLRVDATFRSHALEGSWSRDGQWLVLRAEGHTKRLQISSDGQKLISDGKTAYQRN